jgi:Ni/Fe-hydrogenase subunit HybB-like protein
LNLVCGDCPDAIAWPVLWGVWWVAEFPAWVSLALGGLSLVVLVAWFQSKRTKRIVTLLSLYSVAVIACTVYLVWWHASGQVFDL